MQPPSSSLWRDANDDTWAGMTATESQSVLFDTNAIDPEKYFNDNYQGDKATEVFYVPELAEHILSYLDMKDLAKATRTCKRLRDTLQSSQKLRTFHVALSNMPKHIVARENEIDGENVADRETNTSFEVVFNPLVFEPIKEREYGRALYTELLQSLWTPHSRAYDGHFDGRLYFDTPWCLQQGYKDHARLSLFIWRPKDNKDLLQVQGGVRDMVLAYQPRSYEMKIELFVRSSRVGPREHIRVKVRLVPKLTAGGLVDVVNSIWKCLCDSEQNLGNISKETLEDMAKRHGRTVEHWLEPDVRRPDVKVEINYPWWFTHLRDE